MNITELFNYKISSLKLSLKVLEVEELDKIYQVTLVGGNNGYSDWPRYLNDLSRLMYSIDNCWLIDIKNDVSDDIHYIKIGMKKPFEDTLVKTIPVIEVKATFTERYFEKNDKIIFNNSSWLVTDRPVRKGEGYEVTLRPLNTNYGGYREYN